MNASRAAAADDDDAPVFAEIGSETTDHFHTKVEAGNYTGARTHTLKCAYRDLLIISGKKVGLFCLLLLLLTLTPTLTCTTEFRRRKQTSAAADAL